MPGTLVVVATPIGNLEDITLRALRVLREADLIAAEDTRRTARLLARHGIATPTISFHEHNVRSRLPQLTERLLAGASVAMVTDAGTPGISDPGVRLVQACREQGIPVDVAPGPSAPLAAAVLSGFPLVPLTIHGFAPSRSKDRAKWLADLYETPHTTTFFETPHRIRETLSEAAHLFGERPMFMAREMTKAHQEGLLGTASSLAGGIENPRGEYTLVLGPAQKKVKQPIGAPPDDLILHEFGQMMSVDGAGRRMAIRSIAQRLGLSSKDVYSAIERAKK